MLIDDLLNLNRNCILSSHFQNTLYNGQPLYEYFGECQKSTKKGYPFEKLVKEMIVKIVPRISYYRIYENLNEFEAFKDKFFLVSPYENAVGKVADFIDYYKSNPKVLFYYPPSGPMHINYYVEYADGSEGVFNYAETDKVHQIVAPLFELFHGKLDYFLEKETSLDGYKEFYQFVERLKNDR